MVIETIKKTAESLENTPQGFEIAKLCAAAAHDKKAHDIIILSVAPLTSFADYFVICSAPSNRQVQAIVRNVEDVVRAHHIYPLGIEGLETYSWVLIDLGEVVFHCFTDSVREYYDLEGFWIDADRIEFK